MRSSTNDYFFQKVQESDQLYSTFNFSLAFQQKKLSDFDFEYCFLVFLSANVQNNIKTVEEAKQFILTRGINASNLTQEFMKTVSMKDFYGHPRSYKVRTTLFHEAPNLLKKYHDILLTHHQNLTAETVKKSPYLGDDIPKAQYCQLNLIVVIKAFIELIPDQRETIMEMVDFLEKNLPSDCNDELSSARRMLQELISTERKKQAQLDEQEKQRALISAMLESSEIQTLRAQVEIQQKQIAALMAQVDALTKNSHASEGRPLLSVTESSNTPHHFFNDREKTMLPSSERKSPTPMS